MGDTSQLENLITYINREKYKKEDKKKELVN